MRAQDRLRRLRCGKTPPLTTEELAEWRVNVDDPAPTLRKITYDTRPKAGRVVATPGPREGELLWWVDRVLYTDDPDVIRWCALKRTTVEDAPGGVPAAHVAQVEAEQRRRAARREARKRKKAASEDADGRTSTDGW
ncbi:hypothetical protein PWG71_28490 [Nocardiopsis sp. N85]|uniref:hypothetical protein n=1 Tax=Nocardiopsis sp. N85 TaxID=3029400 RepID=UPI00237F27B7|nr:hypothetical protein [Nocardiopsis sp. N85]MDE3725336.1 hypothetical protein [Nocardiopsis sp. N85]